MTDRNIYRELDHRFGSRLVQKYHRIYPKRSVGGSWSASILWGAWKNQIIRRYQRRFNMMDSPLRPPMICAYLDPMRLRRVPHS